MRKDALIRALTELAEELDKGDDCDVSWTKYQGTVVRRAIASIVTHDMPVDQKAEARLMQLAATPTGIHEWVLTCLSRAQVEQLAAEYDAAHT